MKGVLSSVDLDDASLVRKAKASPGLVGRDLVREVIPDQARAVGRRPVNLGEAAGGAEPGLRAEPTFTSSPSTTA